MLHVGGSTTTRRIGLFPLHSYVVSCQQVALWLYTEGRLFRGPLGDRLHFDTPTLHVQYTAYRLYVKPIGVTSKAKIPEYNFAGEVLRRHPVDRHQFLFASVGVRGSILKFENAIRYFTEVLVVG